MSPLPTPGKKKSIWPKLLIGGTVSLLALGGTGLLVWNHHKSTRLAMWRKEGLAAAVAGDNEKASRYLGSYLATKSHDLESRSEAYITAREQVESPNGQHISDTLKALKIILGDAPDRLEDREHLLRLYARLQRRPEALDTAAAVLAQIEALIKDEKDPAKLAALTEKLRPIKAECLGIKTEVLLGDLKIRDALNVCDEWIKAAPTALAPQMMRIDIRVRLGQPLDAVIKESQQAVAAKPRDPSTELLLGYALLHDGQKQRIEAAMWLRSAAKDLNPSDPAQAELVDIVVAQFNAMGARKTPSRSLKTSSSAAPRQKCATSSPAATGNRVSGRNASTCSPTSNPTPTPTPNFLP